MLTVTRYLSPVILCLAISACGGGGGGGGGNGGTVTTPPPVTNQSVGGIWRAQYTASNGDAVTEVGLASETGSFYLESKNDSNDCAGVALGTLTVSGNSVTGTAKAGLVSFAVGANVQTGCVYSDGSTSASFTVTGTVTQRSQLVLTVTGTTSGGTALPSQMVTYTYDSLYGDSSSLSKVAGTWTGATGVTITISPSGAISAQVPTSGCVISGQVSIINSNYNAYTEELTYSNCVGGAAVLNGLSATGLFTIDDLVTPYQLIGGASVNMSNGVTIVAVTDSDQTSGGSSSSSGGSSSSSSSSGTSSSSGGGSSSSGSSSSSSSSSGASSSTSSSSSGSSSSSSGGTGSSSGSSSSSSSSTSSSSGGSSSSSSSGGQGFTPSPNGTTIEPPTTTAIVDSLGNNWTIQESNSEIFENGVYSTNTQNVILLLYWNGRIYQQNNLCAVYVFNSNNHWVATTYPAGAPDPLAVTQACPVVSIPTAASFNDISGNSWTVKSGQIYENGEVSASTENVILLMYYNNTVYQQNNICNVYAASNASSAASITWTLVPFPAGASYQVPTSVLDQCPGMGGIWTLTDASLNGTYTNSTGIMLSTGADSSGNSQFYFQTTLNVCGAISAGTLSATQPAPGQNLAYIQITGQSIYLTCTPNGNDSNYDVFTFNGTLYPASSLQLTGTDGTNTISLYWEFQGVYTYPQVTELYFEPSQLSTITGTWVDSTSNYTYTIDSSGKVVQTVTGQTYSPPCTGNPGQITILDPTYQNSPNGSYDMYSFALNASPCGEPTFSSGLLYVDTSQTPFHLIGGGGLDADGYPGGMLSVNAVKQ